MVIQRKTIYLGERKVGYGEPCFFIAEAGVNHNGDPQLARKLIDAAVSAGADAVKFQAFNPSELVTENAPQADYQSRNLGSRTSQKEMLAPLAFSSDQFFALKRYCDEQRMAFLCTPFDDDNARLVVDLGCPAIKVGSGDLTNHLFLARVARFGLPVLLSTGMGNESDVRDALEVIREEGGGGSVLLHCVSNYPATVESMNLRAMQSMADDFDVIIGLSDHTLGDTVALAAVALGACIIEKHLTLDRTMAGPDHAASMEPLEFAEMVRKARIIESALGDGVKRPVAGEEQVATVARRSLAAARDLESGIVLREEDLTALRPEGGIAPSAWKTLIGKRTRLFISKGTQFREDMYS